MSRRLELGRAIYHGVWKSQTPWVFYPRPDMLVDPQSWSRQSPRVGLPVVHVSAF